MLIPLVGWGQVRVMGTVTDGSSKEPLVGARVILIGQTIGALTNAEGKFEFRVPSSPPFSVEVTYLGYDTLVYEVTQVDKALKLSLNELGFSVGEVEITASAFNERQRQSPLSIESMSINAIKETPADNFYDGLGHLKGVDLTAASIGFKIVNTRGFNSTSPVRSLQIIDGVDNQAPGLNFSLGNFLGASDLDVEQVDLIVGASSAFYGPNAFNGVISMKTKNPFIHQGLSASLKLGERNLRQVAIRYAKAFRNKAGEEKVAFKLNAFYLDADDWEADNLNPVDDSDVPITNPGGYDAVNRYGDENLNAGINNATSLGEQIILPGLGRWFRTGYEEVDLVDYNSQNLKISGALHIKLGKETEFIAASSFGTGTTVYQGDNRYSLKNILFYQNRLEIRKEDKFFLRAYATHENAGDSYDAVFTAFRLQDLASNNNDWSVAYRNFWAGAVSASSPFYIPGGVTGLVRNLEGFPSLGPPPDFFYDFDLANQILANNQTQLAEWHQLARDYADNSSLAPYLRPGTPEFQAAFDQITSTPISEGGTRLVDRSALYHLHGEYKFNTSFADFVVGGNGRLYTPVSEGSVFKDTADITITNYEFGVYTGVNKQLLDDRLKLNATLRMDKNENFNAVFSPAISAVYDLNSRDIFRISFSSAVRNPTLADQFLFYNVGRAILIGNLDGYQNLVDTSSLRTYFNSPTLDASLLNYFDVDPIQPEKVQTVELGYRSVWFQRLFLDASYYYSRYRDFIGYNIGVDVTFDQVFNRIINATALRVAANAQEVVTTQGFSVGLNYFFDNGLALNGNYSWNRLNTESDDPIIPAFNTPEHKYNLGISGRNLSALGLDQVGFNVNYKWVEGFLFEGSPQFTGNIPSYTLLDVQVNKFFPKLKSTLKIGASNVLDNRQFQAYGGPRVGRLAYFSILTEIPNR